MWKDICGFEDRYEINEFGEIRNKKTQNYLSCKIDKSGYQQIGLRKLGDRKRYWFSVHRLVATHFISITQSSNLQVDHIDNNKLNNHVTNLRWVTSVENNSNRKLSHWATNKTKELYISAYKNGYMIRINRKNYKKRLWVQDLKEAICQRDKFIAEFKEVGVAT